MQTYTDNVVDRAGPNADTDEDGWTDLEEALYFLAVAVQ